MKSVQFFSSRAKARECLVIFKEKGATDAKVIDNGADSAKNKRWAIEFTPFNAPAKVEIEEPASIEENRPTLSLNKKKEPIALHNLKDHVKSEFLGTTEPVTMRHNKVDFRGLKKINRNVIVRMKKSRKSQIIA